MKKLFLCIAVLFATYSVSAQLPDLKIENGKGEMVSISALAEGKTPMIISFWSTTCKPCILELNAINDQLVDWLDEVEFRVIAVSIDDARSSSKAKSLATGNGWDDFTVLYDKNQEFKRALNVNMVPHVFIFDKNGKQIYSHTGYTPGSEAELLKKLKAL